MKAIWKDIREVLIIAVIAASILGFFGGSFSIQSDKMKSHIGEKVIVDRDTLTITSFSVLSDEYMLSNGTSISSEYLNNIK